MSGESDRTAKSPHAFMAEALGVQTRLLEHRRNFLAAAHAAEQDALESGLGYRAADVDAYFEACAAERTPPPIRLRKWRR